MAASMARFFKIIARNGHGEYWFIVPAPSKRDLLNNLKLPNNEALISVEHLRFHLVESWPDEEHNSVEFRANVNGLSCTYNQNHQGYTYLVQQFSEGVKNINDFYDERYADQDD
ncbi:hypothetical protein LJR159_000972 [Pseudomonas brassicacearum]|uniref:hypothetical protein n=1 Tax=Pseudomonas brassicacearum TaxID=930166 RepID=UPI003ECC9FCC